MATGGLPPGCAEICTGTQILLLGRPDELVVPVLEPASWRDLPDLRFGPTARAELRAFWLRRAHGGRGGFKSDAEVHDEVVQAVKRGELRAILMLDVRSASFSGDRHAAALPRPTAPEPAAAGKDALKPSRPEPAADRTAFKPSQPEPAPARKDAYRLPLDERIIEVVYRTADQAPGELRTQILAMATPENLAVLAAGFAAAIAVQGTPAGPFVDAALIGLAYYFGGMAAIEALGEVATAAVLTANPSSDKDLDEAAKALSRAVVAVGVAALMAILHGRVAKGRAKAPQEVLKPSPKRQPDFSKPIKKEPAPNSLAGAGAPKLTRTPTSGVPIVADPNKTTTILGRYDSDLQYVLKEVGSKKSNDFGPKPGGFNILDVDDAAYKLPGGGWDAERFWLEQNVPFLKAAMERGDNLAIATRQTASTLNRTLPDGTVVRSGFGREIDFIRANADRYGYVFDPKTSAYKVMK